MKGCEDWKRTSYHLCAIIDTDIEQVLTEVSVDALSFQKEPLVIISVITGWLMSPGLVNNRFTRLRQIWADSIYFSIKKVVKKRMCQCVEFVDAPRP